jgi:hypothetical protein
MLMMDIGMPLYRPVIVKNPLSEDKINGLGDASRNAATELALEGSPTVTYK